MTHEELFKKNPDLDSEMIKKIDDIIECATSGFFKSKELSDITKLERHTILRWVKASGLKPKWRKTKLTIPEINKILSKIVNLCRVFN